MIINKPFQLITTCAFILMAHLTFAQVENGCIFIDFESIPNTTLQSGTMISNQFEADFGLTFSLENGSSPVLAQVGSPVEAFSSPWGEDTPAPGVDIGQFFITDDGVLSGLSSSPLILEFDIPIDTFSGCILDVDFGEEFLIEAFDSLGNILLSERIIDGDDGTGDGFLTCWGFNMPGCIAAITKIRFSGFREELGEFGLGMDNFRFCYTGANIEVEVEEFSCNKPGQITLISTTNEVYEFSLDNVNFSLENVFGDLGPGKYEVFIRDSDGCVEPLSVEVLDVVPAFTSAEVIHTSCNEDNGALLVEVTPNNNAVISINNMSFSESLIIDELPAGIYDIYIEDENGCELDTVLVIDPSLEPPEITDVVIGDDLCINNMGFLQVTASGGTGNLSFSLDGLGQQASSSFENLPSGDYTITVEDEEGCRNEIMAFIDNGDTINVLSKNIVAPDCKDNLGEFELIAIGGSGDFTFFIDGLPVQSESLFQNLPSGIYNVIVEDDLGCEARITVEIPCTSCGIYFPNVITPDIPGPDSRFKVFASINYDVKIKLYNIYDRWGNLVYTASDFHILTVDDVIWWDGFFNNTKVVEGVYTYLVIVEDPCGLEELFANDVMVIR